MKFTHSKISFSGLTIDNLSMRETIELVKSTILYNGDITLTDVNAGKVIQILEDAELRESVQSSEVIQADGQAVVWASKFLGKPLKERVAGVDLVESLIKLAHKNKFKIFFFGAKEEVVKTVVQKYSEIYSHDIIAGYRNGYFSESESEKIAQQIVDSGA